MSEDPVEARAQKLRDLQQLVNFLEFHTELELPDLDIFTHYSWEADDKTVRATAQALRTFEKKYSNEYLYLSKKFGHITLRYCFTRSGICERTQVGTKKEKRTEATAYTEREVEVPIYEYNCPSLMNLEIDEEEEQQ